MRRAFGPAAAFLFATTSLGSAGEVDFFPPVPIDDIGATPAVATDGAGTWVVVSEDANVPAGIHSVRSTDSGINWSAPAMLDMGIIRARPGLATDGSTWIAVWEKIIGADSDVVAARSIDGGVTWSVPVALTFNAAGDTRTDRHPVVAAGGGVFVAVWEARGSGEPLLGSDSDLMFARSIDGGMSWSVPAPLNADATTDTVEDDDSQAALATDGTGTWIAAWAYRTFVPAPFDSEIRIARSVDGGLTWAGPVSLDNNAPLTAAADAGFPAVASDRAGTWVATWHSIGRQFDGIPDPLGDDDDLLFTRSTDDGATWSTASPLNANAATDKGDDFLPDIASDGAGTWIAVWTSTDTLGRTIDTDADLLMAWSSDGTSWSPPEPLDLDATGDSNIGTDVRDDLARLATDGAGSWLAVWQHAPLGGSEAGPDRVLAARGPVPGCPVAPRPACLAASKASLRIKESVPGKETLTGTMGAFAAPLALGDLGDPVGGTSLYEVCVYDDLDTLVGEMVVARASGICRPNFRPCWRLVRGTTFSYSDAKAWAGGLRRLKARSGSEREAKIVLKGNNKTGQFPIGMAAALAGRPSALMQLTVDDGGCMGALLETVTVADGLGFAATR